MRRTTSFMFFLIFCVRTANPCTCSSNSAVCAVYWNTQLLFRGRIANIKYVPDELRQQVTDNGELRTVTGPARLEAYFHVTERLRGEVGSEVVIRTASQGSACGVEFLEGAEYLVYGYQQANGEWWTNTCTRTHEIIDAEHDPDLMWIRGLAKAQNGSTILGTVTQAQPDFVNNGYQIKPLGGISIQVKGPERRSVRTDDQGKFSVSNLPIGNYEVSPEYPNDLGPSAPLRVSVRDKGCAVVHFSAQSDGIVDGNIFNADLMPASGLYIRLKRIE